MPDEPDYPSYSRETSSNVLLIKYLGGSFFFCGAVTTVSSEFIDCDDHGAGLCLSGIVALIAVVVFCSQSDFCFRRLAQSKSAAWVFPLVAYACIAAGSFLDYPFGIAIQSVGLTFTFMLWLVAFEAKRRILTSLGIILLLSGLMILVGIWLYANADQLPDVKAILLALLLSSAAMYLALPSKYRMNTHLLVIGKGQSIEHLPTRHDKSMVLFGLLRGLLIGYSAYLLLSSMPENPTDAIICCVISIFCLLVLSIRLFSSYEGPAHNTLPKQIELFSSSLFWIVALLALVPFVGNGLVAFTVGVMILLYAIRRSIHCTGFSSHWAFTFEASPITAIARSLIGSFSGILLGWSLAIVPLYFDWAVLGGLLFVRHVISIAVIAFFIYVVTRETTNRLASSQDEIKNLIGEIAVRDENAEQLENLRIVPGKVGKPPAPAPIVPQELYFKQGDLQLEAGQSMYHHVFAESLRLTGRQTEVLMFLLKGRSTAYICSQLFISSATTRSHVQSIYKKAGVHSQQKLMETFDDFVLHAVDQSKNP